MLKKRSIIFLSLLILGILLLSSCFLKPPVTEGILKGQVIVPEGTLQAKDLTGQALPDATVNIIDPVTGAIIATTVTDADGYYQVFVPAGGPYLLQVVKDEVVILQITPQVEVGIEYDLGTADCNTTAVALIALAMMDAGADLADINLADIAADPNFDDVLSNVTSIIEAGGDPTESAVIEQAVEDFLSPPAPAPPALSSAKEINSYKFEEVANAALSSDVIGTVDFGAHTVALTVPYGTNLTALVATFELSASAAAKIGSTEQVSGTTANDFTSPVTYTVTAEDSSTQDWVVTVTVAIGPLHHFNITGYPATVIAGVTFASDVVVTAYDADNNVKTDYTGEVYFTSIDGSAALPYTLGSKYTFTAGDNGVHTFSGEGFILKTAGLQNITLTDGTVSVGSSTITVNPAVADYFKVTGTASMTAGSSNTITITAYDQYDNVATGYSGDKTLTFSGASSSSGPVTSPTCSNKSSADINFASDTVITFTDGVGTSTMKLYKAETAHVKATEGSIATSDSNDLDVDVSAGSLNYVKVEDTAGGAGSEVTTHSMTADETFIVYAAGYDAYGNYKNDQSVNWTGTGVCDSKLSPVSGTFTTFTPTGEGTGAITADHATVTDDTTGTITVWNLIVTYNGNGNTSGTAPIDSNNPHASGEEVTVLDKGNLVKTGYTFVGWNTQADGSGTDRAVGSTFILGASNVTLYAKWTINTYTVTFDSKGGTAVVSQTVDHGGKATEPTEPTRTGYTFGGWYKESGCTNVWDFTTDTVTADVTLYAKWTINTYTVIYNGNGNTGGTVPVDSSSPYEYGATVTVLDNTGTLVRTDYTFDGWNTQADGNGTGRAVGSTFILGASNVTLYAKWTSLTTYSLRDIGPAGGLIFYINPNYLTDGWQYLEAAPSDQIEDTQWGCYGTLITGADGTAVGTGEQNTIDIENGCATAGTAADICANLNLGGYSDWFLPSKDELNLMYTNLKLELVGDFYSTIYWSSSEASANSAWYQHFMDGKPFSYEKKYGYGNVRAARAF